MGGLLGGLAGIAQRYVATEEEKKQKKIAELTEQVLQLNAAANDPQLTAMAGNPNLSPDQRLWAQSKLDDAKYDALQFANKYGGDQIKQHRGFLSKVLHGMGTGLGAATGMNVLAGRNVPQIPMARSSALAGAQGPSAATPSQLATPMPGLASQFSIGGGAAPISSMAAAPGAATPAGLSPQLAYSPATKGQPVGGLYPIDPEVLARARLQILAGGPKGVELSQLRSRLSDAVDRGEITQEDAKDAIARAITGAPASTGAEQTRIFGFPDGHTEYFHVGKTGEFFDQYGRRTSGGDIEARGGKERAKPPGQRILTRTVSGQDPMLQRWAAENPGVINIDPNDTTQKYTYNYTWDPSNPTEMGDIIGFPGISAQTGRQNLLQQFRDSAKYVYKGPGGRQLTQDEANAIGSLEWNIARGTSVGAAQQRMKIQEFLTGEGPGMGIMLPQNMLPPGVTPISSPPPGMEPLPQSLGGTGEPLDFTQPPSEPTAPSGAPAAPPPDVTTTPPATATPPSTAPAAPAPTPTPQATPPATPAAAAPPIAQITPPALQTGTGAVVGAGTWPNGQKLTLQQQAFVSQWVNSMTKDGFHTPAGAQRGYLLLQQAGANPDGNIDTYTGDKKALQAAQQQKDAMNRFTSQIDLFGGQWQTLASQLPATLGPEITRGPIRTLITRVLGSPELRKYQAALAPVQRSYEQLLANAYQSKAQLPKFAQDASDKIISGDIKYEEVVGLLQQIKTEGKIEMRTFDENIYNIRSSMSSNPIGRALGNQPPKPLPPLEGGGGNRPAPKGNRVWDPTNKAWYKWNGTKYVLDPNQNAK